MLDISRQAREHLAEVQKWEEGVKHGHDLVVASVRRTALHRREDATLCVCMTCGITWREDEEAP
jgi:hypothetical protein